MRSRVVPSPSLVLACLALAIALGGTAYAASLPRNSVGSPQVKANSLKGWDIRESTLQGVQLGQGVARAGTKILPPGSDYKTLLRIPKVLRVEANCGSGSPTGLNVFNISDSPSFMWARWSFGTTSFAITAGQRMALLLNSRELVEVVVQTDFPKRTTVVHVGTEIDAGVHCKHTAVAETVFSP